jgi:hypothetical protein
MITTNVKVRGSTNGISNKYRRKGNERHKQEININKT